jgi:hypothetical protein
MNNFPNTLIARLAELALRLFFQKCSKARKDRMRPLLGVAIRRGLQLMAEDEAAKAVAELEAAADKRRPRSPPVIMQMMRILGTAGAVDWVHEHDPQLGRHPGTNGQGRRIVEWLAAQPPDLQKSLFEAGLRRSTGDAKPNDQELFLNSLGTMLSRKEAQMADPNFIFDVSRLPQSVRDSANAFKQEVIRQLAGFPAPTNTQEKANVEAVVIGMLLLDEQFNFTTPTFSESVRRAWEETLDKHRDFDGNEVKNITVYNEVVKFIVANRSGASTALPSSGSGGGGGATTVDIFYQEFAFASRHAIQNVRDNPPPGESFKTQVKIGLERYVAGRPALESLELPPLTGADGSDVEIEPENIRAVALVYAAVNLEEMRMFHVVDRITEIFNNGQLPVGFDAGGRALDTYYFDREDRLNEAERRMIYSRVLGAPGGMISKEVQPNTQFDGLWIRFLSSLAEFDRQQRVDEIIATRTVRPQNLTGEYVRKAGRDLAANVSLYGWGGTHFAARRLNGQIATSLDILNQPSIQKAYGVTNPYQLIERVAAAEFGMTPNIVRLRTMADAGNKILNIVAKYPSVWTRPNGQPLFQERIPGNPYPAPGDITLADREELMNQTQFWLAVNGIKDDQVGKLSQPEQARYEPSIPTFAGMLPGNNGAVGNGKVGADTVERLKQMVMAGQAPSLDQLKQLLPM